MEAMKDNPAVRWVFDHPEYEATGIRYYGQYKPARLEVCPPIGPDYEITPGMTFRSCTAFEMLRDATDNERRGMPFLENDGTLDSRESYFYARSPLG